ncbi:GTPase RsgA [Rhodococcus hoagii]|nr:GTPase RsgA [Prescottella equi]
MGWSDVASPSSASNVDTACFRGVTRRTDQAGPNRAAAGVGLGRRHHTVDRSDESRCRRVAIRGPQRPRSPHWRIGVDVVTVSARPERASTTRCGAYPEPPCLLGPSGAGKSSLTNRPAREDRMDYERGPRHRPQGTAHHGAPELFPVPGGGVLMTTPGAARHRRARRRRRHRARLS